jgi:hypothetical protein
VLSREEGGDADVVERSTADGASHTCSISAPLRTKRAR